MERDLNRQEDGHAALENQATLEFWRDREEPHRRWPNASPGCSMNALLHPIEMAADGPNIIVTLSEFR